MKLQVQCRNSLCRLKQAEKTLLNQIEKINTEMEELRLEAKQLLLQGQKQTVCQNVLSNITS